MTRVTLYGIPNCDRVRAARKWLDRRAVDHRFHDIRADGLTRAQLEDWAARLGVDRLLNRRSTTWRQLPERTRAGLTDAAVIDLLLIHPTLLKRPLLDIDGALSAGFDEAAWSRALER